jgi:transcriptional regulator with XRE-family HTH domain
MNERLATFLKAEQLSPAQFADLMGIQRSGVSHLMAGRNKPGFDFFLTFLKKFPVVNIEWLISGRGKMYKEMEIKPLFPEFAMSPDPKNATAPDNRHTPVVAPLIPEAAAESPVPPATSAKAPESRRIEKVLILYSDGTFSDFVAP